MQIELYKSLFKLPWIDYTSLIPGPAVTEAPLHDLKFGGFCAISAWKIIRPLIFHKTISSEHYVRLILSPFFNQLADDEKSYGHFMQDNATA